MDTLNDYWIQYRDGQPLKVTQMCGSLEFISPEVLECTEATTSTDCWGVGVIAYMLVTGGRSPFYGGNRFRTMGKILMAQGRYFLSMLRRDVPRQYYAEPKSLEWDM